MTARKVAFDPSPAMGIQNLLFPTGVSASCCVATARKSKVGVAPLGRARALKYAADELFFAKNPVAWADRLGGNKPRSRIKDVGPSPAHMNGLGCQPAVTFIWMVLLFRADIPARSTTSVSGASRVSRPIIHAPVREDAWEREANHGWVGILTGKPSSAAHSRKARKTWRICHANSVACGGKVRTDSDLPQPRGQPRHRRQVGVVLYPHRSQPMAQD